MNRQHLTRFSLARLMAVVLLASVVVVVSVVAIAPDFIKHQQLRREAVRTTELLTAHDFEVTKATPCLRKFEGVLVSLEATTPVDECQIKDILRKAEIMSGIQITVRTNGTIADQFYFWPSQPHEESKIRVVTQDENSDESAEGEN